MNILIINGENHKGSTYHIARQVADKIAAAYAGTETDEIWLPEELPEFCCGCARCVLESESKCPHYTYTERLTEKIDKADVLILESPVFVFHCSGSMKAFLDHYAYRWMLHRPEGAMFSKQAVCISTAAGGGMKKTNTDMKDSLYWWGVPKIHTYGKAVAAVGWNHVSDKKKKQIDAATTRLAMRIIRSYGRVKPGLLQRALFLAFRRLQRSGWNPADSTYWQNKGWTKNIRPWKAGII